MSAKQISAVVVCAMAAMARPAMGQQFFLPAACDIKPGNSLVDHGMGSLKSAFTTKFADQKTKDLKDAEKNLTQAVTTGKQEKNPAAWYYLGRYYLMTDDAAGADSALTKALALAPACKEDIQLYRRQAWVPVFNAGVQVWQAGNTDSAIAVFRRANQLYQGEPNGLMSIGRLFFGVTKPDPGSRSTDAAKYRSDSLLYETRADSAAKYFRLAIPAAADPKYARDRRDAWFFVGLVYHSVNRYAEAAAAYREFLVAYPNDVPGLANLASLLMRAGKRDSATTLYDRILARTDSANPDDLFSAAQGIMSGAPQLPDTVNLDLACVKAGKKKTPAQQPRLITARCQAAAVDSMRAFHATADPQFRLATRTYDALLGKNPYHHDALSNLWGISYMLGDTSRMLPLAQRLYGVDPLNRNTLTKVAGSWQMRGKKDSVNYYLGMADTLPVEISVSNFTTSEKDAILDLLATNVRPKASGPVSITFEFLDTKGTVVDSLSQRIGALDANANQAFKLKAEKPGIAGWRYHRS